MVDRDIILAKVQNIKDCLATIHKVVGNDPDKLDVFPNEDVFVLNVQRAVQSAIDAAAHIVASENLGLPRTMAETFDILAKHPKVDKNLIAPLKSMVGFRNIAVHHYTEINKNILKKILTHHLKDLDRFCNMILQVH